MIERVRYSVYFAAGRLLRAGKYSSTRGGGPEVRKVRRFHAPFVVGLGNRVLRALDTGIYILPQRQWEARERELYAALYAQPVRVEQGTLVLPRLPGRTLAALLDDPRTPAADRSHAVELAVGALADLHRRGWTHGDAMADNVMIDLAADRASWFDFETAHEARRSPAWQQADDVRALLSTCIVRTSSDRRAALATLLLDAYPDQAVVSQLAEHFGAVRRPLAFQLGQAAMSYRVFAWTGALLRARRRPASGAA